MQSSENDLQPKKRSRPLKRESREGVTDDDGDDDYEDEMPLSQSSMDGDECPPRTLFTREERVTGSVEKYSDQFVQLLDQLEHRQQSGAFQCDGVDLITHVEVRALLQTLKSMRKRDMIGKVDPDLLMVLMGALNKQVCSQQHCLGDRNAVSNTSYPCTGASRHGAGCSWDNGSQFWR